MSLAALQWVVDLSGTDAIDGGEDLSDRCEFIRQMGYLLALALLCLPENGACNAY